MWETLPVKPIFPHACMLSAWHLAKKLHLLLSWYILHGQVLINDVHSQAKCLWHQDNPTMHQFNKDPINQQCSKKSNFAFQFSYNRSGWVRNKILSTLVESVYVLDIFNHSQLIVSIRCINIIYLHLLKGGGYPIRSLCSEKNLDICRMRGNPWVNSGCAHTLLQVVRIFVRIGTWEDTRFNQGNAIDIGNMS